jgi:hypothetical protein
VVSLIGDELFDEMFDELFDEMFDELFDELLEIGRGVSGPIGVIGAGTSHPHTLVKHSFISFLPPETKRQAD